MTPLSMQFGQLRQVDTGAGVGMSGLSAITQHGDARKVTITGMDGLIKKMAELPTKLRSKIARNAADIAANTILQAVLARTPIKSGKLKAGIKKQAARVRRGVGRLVTLPDRSVLGISPSDLYYWPAALEYGHASPGFGVYSSLTKKRVRRTGLKHIPSWSFLRSGFDAVEKIAGAQLIRSIDAALAQEFARP